MNFVAIDFETATNNYDSACSVAIVEVEDGNIVDTYYTLIKPPKLQFCSKNISIHGITPDMVKGELEFNEVWENLEKRISNKIVVAHNASFDMKVLRSCLNSFGLSTPNFKYACTVRMARNAWPNLSNHKLNTVGKYLQITFNHHHALDDAKTCAAIPLTIAKQIGAESFLEMARKINVNIKNFS